MNQHEWESAPVDASTALAWLHAFGVDACDLDDRSQVEHVLGLVPIAQRNADPACLAVRAALKRYDGHVDKALELYQRALAASKSDARLEVQIRENLAILRILRKETTEAEEVLTQALAIEPDDPRLLAIRAMIRAQRRDRRAQEDIDAIEGAAPTLPDLWRARSYIRASNTAYNLDNVPVAEKFAHLAVESAEAGGSSRLAAIAYQTLMSIYSNHVGDVGLSLHYADLCADASTKGDDKTQWFIALVARYSIAAEIGDRALMVDIRKQLEPLRGAEKYGERFAIVFGDAIYYAWTLAFDTMQQYLNSISLGRINDAQRAICHGFKAIAAAGCGDDAEALKSAYRALSMGRPGLKESVIERRFRVLARVMGAAVLLRANRKSEAMRMFGAFNQQTSLSIRRLMQAVIDDNYATLKDTAPDLVGFGMMFQALNQVEAQIYETSVRLTKREIEILQACAVGDTARMIAQKLGIDEATVVWHRNNVLKKFGVNRTIAAIARGRALRLIP